MLQHIKVLAVCCRRWTRQNSERSQWSGFNAENTYTSGTTNSDECSQVSASTSCWSMQVRQAPTNASDRHNFPSPWSCAIVVGLVRAPTDPNGLQTPPTSHTSAAALAGMSAVGCHICTNSSGSRNASLPSAASLFKQGCYQRSKDGTSFLQAFRCSRAVAHERRCTMLAGDGILSHVAFPWCEQRQQCKGAVEQKAICEGEVVEGEKRHRQHQKVHSKSRQIDEFVKEREMWKAGRKHGGYLLHFPRRSRQFRQRARIGRSMNERN